MAGKESTVLTRSRSGALLEEEEKKKKAEKEVGEEGIVSRRERARERKRERDPSVTILSPMAGEESTVLTRSRSGHHAVLFRVMESRVQMNVIVSKLVL